MRAGLTSFNGEAQAENFPNPSEGERVCFIPYLLRGVGFHFQFICSSEGFWNTMASNCTTSLWPPSCTSQVTSLFASYSWVVRPILNCGESYSVSFRATTRDQYLKCAKPKYGASPRPDTYPAHQRRHPKSGPTNGFILKTSSFQSQFGGDSLSSREFL